MSPVLPCLRMIFRIDLPKGSCGSYKSKGSEIVKSLLMSTLSFTKVPARNLFPKNLWFVWLSSVLKKDFSELGPEERGNEL